MPLSTTSSSHSTMSLSHTLPLLLLLLLLLLISYTAGARSPGAPPRLLRSSCRHASYPAICLRTLSTYPARTPADLARAAVSISYLRAHRASDYLARLRALHHGGATSSAAAAGGDFPADLRDCLEQLSDSAAELGDTLSELRSLRGAFRWHMSNAETWVSAALTDQDTCLDGIGEVGPVDGVREDVRRRIKNVAKVTSNALYLINRLGGTTTRDWYGSKV